MSEQNDRSGQKASQRAGIAIVIVLVAITVLIWVQGDAAYPWVKALHVMAIISWMAGLLYLPRLFVYHTDAKPGSESSETFKAMERRLLKVIMTPAMGIAWLAGLWLAWKGHHWSEPWFHLKFALVVALSGFQGYLSASARAFAEDRNTKSSSHWRMLNEVPAALMVAIVVLVIVKPFG